MIRTHGMTHLALYVRDVRRSSAFYCALFGMKETYARDGWVQLETPGSMDLLVFEQNADRAGVAGGIAHFGFRLVNPADAESAARFVMEAGGTVTSRGEFCPGEPYIFALDPDGYEVEIAYEPEGRRDR